jgi:GxxExxY protein
MVQNSNAKVDRLLFKEECYQIIGFCMKIHSVLGKGFKETVYKDALEFELRTNNIPYEREKQFLIKYQDNFLPHKFDADFFVYDSIILEVKAILELRADNFKQTLNYIKSSHVKLGVLINFGEDRLKFKRIVCSC